MALNVNADSAAAVVAAALRRTTAGLAMGVEPAVSLVVDALFPVSALVDLCAGFAKEFPNVDLRGDTQVLSAVRARVLDGSATSGVAAPPAVNTVSVAPPMTGVKSGWPVTAAGHDVSGWPSARRRP